MSVVIASEDVGPCRQRLTIEVPAEAMAAEMGRVIGDHRRKIKLPGFRRGKVPASLVKKRFRQEIEQEMTERLVPRYWHQAQAEKNLDLLLPPRFEDLTIEDGEPMTFVASVEIRPEIDLGDVDELVAGLKLPEERTEPIDEEIESALSDIRSEHATWRSVDRGAALGDRVVATIQDSEGETRPGHIELGGQGVGEELNLALTGLAAGHSTESRGALGVGPSSGRRTGPAGGEEAEETYRITADEVQEKDLPELDEELARKLGDFETVEELREAVASGLRHSKEMDLRRRREQALREQLRERQPVELPAGVVQQQSEEMLHRYAEQLAGQGVDLERAEIDWEALMKEVRPRAEQRVHERLLLDAVARAKGLRLDEREFESVLASLAAQQQSSTIELRRQLSKSGRIEALRAELLRGQTVRHLLGEDSSESDDDDPGTSDGEETSK